MTLLDLALTYASAGWPVFPLEPHGKQPLGQLAPHGLKDATTDEAVLRNWWGQEPNANIGIATGVAFDAGDLDNDEAMKGFIAICSEHGNDPRHLPRTKTGRGRHVLFAPTGLGNKVNVLPGMDWRGKGGYIVAPGSVHPNGGIYEWIQQPQQNGSGPVFPEVPAWLLDRLKPAREPPEPPTGSQEPPPDRYVQKAVEDELTALRASREGERNHALNRAAYSLGQLVGAGWYARNQAEAELYAAALAIGLGQRESRATIRSGLDSGAQEPRQAPPGGWAAAEAGGDIRHGTAAAEATQEPYALSIQDFVARKTQAAIPLIGSDDDVLLPVGGFLLLFARGGKGKTTLSIDAALCLASGVEWLGFPVPKPLRVLIVENEGPMEPFRRKLERKLQTWTSTIEGAVFIKTANWGAFTINQEDEQVELRRFVEAQGIDLVMGDPLDSMGARGVGSPEDTREFMAGLVKVGLTRDVGFWLLHHANKAEWEDELDEVSGAWGGKPDTMLKLAKEPGNRARLSFPKVRWASHQRPANFLSFDPETESFSVAGVEQTEERDLFQELRRRLEDGQLRTSRELSAPKKDGGIGTREPAIKEVLEAHPDVFTPINGAVVGRSPRTTVWRLAHDP